ncbi:BBF_HP2_G0005320.mRNA.1.CDS.1 [Saccharomyces cerevisiae]|nr:BBF_HP2_G0005320.mRNA.1.CDS.1 [Saccharomyces cerevisiae]CAI6408982.1 BBF_HP1_G0005300.mRNA.1.CDS.1 [Saccharomyces cerevisiae]CAI6409304.1 BBF_HP2_G0005320.mRNA.1.CDS.1 [Saccharomyces cerevisiae]
MVATIMQTTTTVLTTVAAMSTTLASNYISSQASSSTSVTTVTTIAASIRSTPSNLLFSNVAAQPKSSSASTIGLSIGLPIGIFCFGLLILLCYFYLKRNSVSISNPPMSATIPREEEYCRRTNWFSRLFWQSKCEDQNSYSNRDIEKYNDTQWTSGDNMSSKIQYKISKPIIPQHILTPKKTVKNPYAWSGKNISLDPKVNEMEEEKVVDAFLYTKPPNIVHIESSMPSYNDLPSQKTVSSKKTALKTNEKWSYESPLSRWFLRGSTYFKDYGLSKTSLKTPTGASQLKQMKMLSRISKGYFNESDIMPDERSPILEYNNTPLDANDSVNNLGNTTPDSQITSYRNNNIDLITARPHSVIYGTTAQQTLETNFNDHHDCNKSTEKHELIIPTPSKPLKKRKKRRQSKMYQHLQHLSRSKPLPLTPNSKYNGEASVQLGKTYTVIQDYEPRLTDEIRISLGEKVKILATHTDGWCLVEKCNTQKGSIHVSVDDKRYLNEDRGIVPGDCLQEYD